MTDPADFNTMLRGLIGKQVAGGCVNCPAYQELEEVRPGTFLLAIRHENNCPTLARHQGRRRA